MSIASIMNRGEPLAKGQRTELATALVAITTIETQLAQVRAFLMNIRGAAVKGAADLPAGFLDHIDAALRELPASID